MRDVRGGFPVYYIFYHYNDTGFISSYDMNILLVKHPRKQFSYVLLTQNMAKLRRPFSAFIRKWHI
ncbi:MAG TPA: hypothetical protein DEU03_08130 [Bacillus sp. (in: Bacteria)]|nr:hypothetical protein [Bacillus thuringiensis]PEF16734.1 hypothetical protein CON87_22760 [Bacillus cereus]HCF53113.1 hypothetical protein [Bacillus sp. (in: firmicutes)]MBG9648821.1 hypothetical protein [Bacillus thuringiensis]MBG9702820.1 hypothetical protein [Bacillus thuringiensis]